jgi:hypothetical protein
LDALPSSSRTERDFCLDRDHPGSTRPWTRTSVIPGRYSLRTNRAGPSVTGSIQSAV